VLGLHLPWIPGCAWILAHTVNLWTSGLH